MEFNWGWIDSSAREEGTDQRQRPPDNQRREATGLTDRAEVEEERQFPAAGQARVGLAQLLKESVRTRLQRRQPGHWRVFQQSGAQGDGLRWGARLEHLMGQGANRESKALLGKGASFSTCSQQQQLLLCSLPLHKARLLELVTLAKRETPAEAGNETTAAPCEHSGRGGRRNKKT